MVIYFVQGVGSVQQYIHEVFRPDNILGESPQSYRMDRTTQGAALKKMFASTLILGFTCKTSSTVGSGAGSPASERNLLHGTARRTESKYLLSAAFRKCR